MTDYQIRRYAEKYRAAIEAAHDDGVFVHDTSFDDFPTGSCGAASYLLAEFLRHYGIETVWNSGQRGDWSHAWLVVKDKRVRKPTPRAFSYPEELRSVIAEYGVEHPEMEVVITNYEADDLKDGLIIDITADQFDDFNIPVYVGYIDSFHQTFELRQARDYDGLADERLINLYREIEKYLR